MYASNHLYTSYRPSYISYMLSSILNYQFLCYYCLWAICTIHLQPMYYITHVTIPAQFLCCTYDYRMRTVSPNTIRLSEKVINQ